MSDEVETATITGTVPPLRGLVTRASTVLPLAGYLAALAAVQTAAARGSPVPAALGHGVLLIAILTHAGACLERAGRGENALGRSLCGLALVPLLGLLGLALGSYLVPAAARVALVALSALAGALLVARVLGLRAPELGLRAGGWHDQLVVAVSGIPLGLLALALGAGEAFEPLRETSPIAPACAIVLAAAVQEVIFRGILATTFGELFGRAGMLWTSALFAATAIASGSVGLVVALALCGLVWAWGRQRTGSIVGTIVAHALVAGTLAFVPKMLG